MMKKILISIIVFLMLISLSFTSPVYALPLDWVKMDDWDDYLIDDTSGSNTYHNWSRTSGNDFKIQGSGDPGGDKYLQISYRQNGGQETNEGYFNNTLNYYGFYFRTNAYLTASSVDSANELNVWYNFYNTSDEIVIKLKHYAVDSYWRSGAYDHKQIFYYYSNQTGWTTLYDTGWLTSFPQYYLSFNYYIDNIIQYTIYDTDDNLIAIANGTGLIGGDAYYNKEQFNITNTTIVATTEAFTDNTYGYYRNREYGYIDEEIYGPGTFPEVMGVVIETNTDGTWYTGIPEICIGDSVLFRVTIIGDEGSHITICLRPESDLGPTPCDVYLSTLYSSIVFPYTFLLNTTYLLTIWDTLNYPEYNGYFSTTNITMKDCLLPQYNETYGEFYAEFYKEYPQCYYIDGSNPSLIYLFNDSTNYTTTDGVYILDIYTWFGMGETREYSTFVNHGDYAVNEVISGITMSSLKNYQIRIFNTTKSGTTYIRDTLIKTSAIVKPCEDLNNNGIPDEFETPEEPETPPFQLPQIEDTTLASIMGLIVVIFCLLIPFIVAGAIGNATGVIIQIPMFVYAITGGLGIGVVTFLGWFPAWIIAFICIVGFITVLIMFLMGKRNEGGY